MVTQKEYEDFQNNHDRQHPLNPDGTPAYSHPTQDDYTRFQEEHDRRHPLNPDGTPAYTNTASHLERLKNSQDAVTRLEINRQKQDSRRGG